MEKGKEKIRYEFVRKEKPKTVITKINIILLIVFVIAELLFYYMAFPVINIHSVQMWFWLIISLLILSALCCRFKTKKGVVTKISSTKAGKVFLITAGVAAVIVFAGGIISSKMICASKYSSILKVEEGTFTEDIPESKNISDIALMDTDSARIIGERAIGSLSDVVSQYEVSGDYSTIDYNGKPMKVASLYYAGFIKYLNNKDDGIPGYVLVDPVKNEAKYVKLDKPIRYSPSACFGEKLERHVQMNYPTKIFNGYYFELDNEGNPYYICPTMTAKAGLFGAEDVKGVVICDPCTGDTEYYNVGDVPTWVDRVYDGDLVCRQYDWYGNLSGGFINSIIGNKGCKVTTDDYGYKVMNDDVWVYTGVTSVNGDESNIGFVMINLRTAESRYYSIAGAEEYSAMSSAEGQVQHLGYVASFPSLINIDGVPTYIMVLKDNAGLVKMYALVNVEKYNIVATGSTQREALNAYNKLLLQNGFSVNDKEYSEEMPHKEIVVADIQYIAVEGNTYVYLTDKEGTVYKQDFAENENLIFIQIGDKITVYYEEDEGENPIKELLSYQKK